jgi:hypothetical protein
MLNNEDVEVILSQVKEPFIQKYLKSLAVHICTLPVTQMVSVSIAIIYVLMHPEMPVKQVWAVAVGIIVLFQVIPVSPGSLVRGSYVLYLVIKERNFKDYNIAVFLGFFKYVGYLAFPIQMTYRYPALARFMAAHWATEVVHIVPVFGERGALLEHWTFCLFYNWPLTIRRQMRKRAEIRTTMKPRYWHGAVCAIAGAIILGVVDLVHLKSTGSLPSLKAIWYLAVILPLTCGAVITAGAGGLVLWKRIVIATICGTVMGVLHTAILLILGSNIEITVAKIVTGCMWRTFVFALFSTIGAMITETKLQELKSSDYASVVS